MLEIGVVALFLFYAVMISYHPATVFSFMVILFSLEQTVQANSAFFANHSQLINYAYGGLVIYAVLVTAIRHGFKLVSIPAAGWLMYSLYIWAALSEVWSFEPAATHELIWGHFPYIAANAILLPLVFREPSDIRSAVVSSLLIGVAVAVLLLVGTQLGGVGRAVQLGIGVENRYGKVEQVGNPLAIADFGGYMVILAIFVRGRGLSHWLGFLRWLIICLGCVLVVRSGSRGQLLAFIVAAVSLLAVSGMISGKISRAGFATIAIGLLAALVMWSLQFSQIERRFDVREWGTEFSQTRIQMCTDLLEHWAGNVSPLYWILGLGAGASFGVIGFYPHVVPVETLCELGVIGFLLYLAILLLVGYSCLRLLFRFRESSLWQSYIFAIIGLWIFDFMLTFKQGSLLGTSVWCGLSIILPTIDRITSQGGSRAGRRYAPSSTSWPTTEAVPTGSLTLAAE